jgi:hypothetical protein
MSDAATLRSSSPSHDHHRRRTRARRGVLGAALIALVTLGIASSAAQAALVEAPPGTKRTPGNPGSGTQPTDSGGTKSTGAGGVMTTDVGASATPLGCASYTWKTPPRVVVHEAEFAAGGGGLGDQILMTSGIGDVVNQFNQMGGTTAAVSRVETSNEPFTFQDWKGDTTPTIHVGFTTPEQFASYPKGGDAAGMTSASPVRGSDCTYREMHIVFPDEIVLPDKVVVPWNFGTPFSTSGSSYYDAKEGPSGQAWFRTPFLHELLHAFGLQHTLDQYSFMNFQDPSGLPWANRAERDSIRPLPYEVGVLRKLYPASGSHYDVAALDTWYGPPFEAGADAAGQYSLCTPSLGTSWSSPTSSGACGWDGTKPGSSTVCPGDTLRTAVALANYSTASAHVTSYLHFSRDEQFDGADPATTSWASKDLDAATSALSKASWTVPDLDRGVTYHPIIRVISEHLDQPTGAADANSVRADWIPLRGTVTAGTKAYCDSRV